VRNLARRTYILDVFSLGVLFIAYLLRCEGCGLLTRAHPIL
jgi:hypothetical protein